MSAKNKNVVATKEEQRQSENGLIDLKSISRAHALFFAPESEGKDFSSVLSDVQEYISENYSTLITGNRSDAKVQMLSLIHI